MEILDFNYYSIPAIVSLFLKFLLLAATRVMPLRNAESKVFLAFLFVLALHNAAEIMGLNYSGTDTGPLRAGLLYYTMSVVAMAVLLHLMLVRLRSSTGWNIPVRQWWWLYLPAVAVLIMLWKSDAMIEGFVPHGFAYTRVPGPLYGWFEAYALIYLVASIGILCLSTLSSASHSQRRKNVITLVGMAPIIIMPAVVILLQKAGVNTFTLPLWFAVALTFFLIVTGYAIYEHRLFNIFFHIPGTRLHRRHTAFHDDIKRFIAELDRLPSVSVEEALNKLAATLKCGVALVGAGRGPVEAEPLTNSRGTGLRFSRLGETQLQDIEDIVLTKELKKQDPGLYSALNDANCAAVIPFRPYKGTSAGWLLLGGGKQSSDELPIDFTLVESLFDRMGDLFLDHLVREREQLNALHKELEHQVSINENLRNELAHKERTIDALYDRRVAQYAASACNVALDEVTAGLEKKVISETLARLQGNVSATAKSLGLTRQTLYAKMDNYGIEGDQWRKKPRKRRK